MKYYLCVDEKGSFENKVFKDQPSSVGGFLCNENQYNQLTFHCDTALLCHNRESKEYSNYPGFDLKLDRLHFRVLHCGQDNLRSDDTWRYPSTLGQIFIKTLLHHVENRIMMICRTAGSPPLNLHPQHSYTVCLVSLIAGIIIDNKDILKNADELVIRAAIRNKKVLTGMALDDPDTYWELFSKQVLKVIKNSGIIHNLNISIDIGNASKDVDLIIADLLLGAINDNIYESSISKFKKVIYDVNNFYHISLSNKPTDFLNRLLESGNTEEALLLALDFKNSINEKQINAGQFFIETHLFEVLADERIAKSFSSMLDARLNNILHERYTNTSALGNIKEIASVIIQTFQKNNKIIDPVLKERCLYYLIHCEAHEGLSPINPADSYSENYEQFLNLSGSQIFPSLPERIHRRLETKLIAVQTLYFNTFLFEELESHLGKDIKKYENAFSIYHNTEKTDDLYARLCGTYGQSLGFIGSINRNENQIKTAIEYLELDVSYLPEKSVFKSQGYSFITSGYWMLNDLNGSRESFKKHYSTIRDDKDLTEMIFKNDPLDGGSIFLYLDWIRYAEMNDRLKDYNGEYIRMSKEIVSLTVNKIKHYVNEYPYNLFIKWVAMMEYRSGAKSKSIKLLELINQVPKDNSIFYIMIFVVTKMMIKSINGESIYDDDINNYIKTLSGRYTGFLRFAEIKGLIDKKELDIEEIARLMPYYYS